MIQAGVLGGLIGGVVYVVLCAIIATKASDTNRSGGWYFFLSLFLSPVVGFITLSLSILAKIEQGQSTPSKSPSHAFINETAARMERSDLTWECQECDEKNPNSTFVCEKCGYTLK